MTLRSYLNYRNFTLPIQAIPTHSKYLAAACQEITRQYNVTLPPPNTQSLETAHREICLHFFTHNTAAAIPCEQLALVPWVLYWPSICLAESSSFMDYYFRWLEKQPSRRQGRILSILWAELLEQYPAEADGFWHICHSVLRLMGGCVNTTIKPLYNACEKYELLIPNGLEQFCNHIETDGIQAALNCRCISQERHSGQFVQQACLLYLSKLSAKLTKPGNLSSLQRFFLQYQESEDVFLAVGKARIIEALLLPFVDSTQAEKEYRDQSCPAKA